MPDHDYLKTVTIGAPETPKDTIVLCDYDPHWLALYAQEHVKIARALAGQSVRIEHVGFTSVPGLCAKPIIDILLLVDDAASEERYAPALEAAGYTLRVREPDWYEHRMFKGQSPTVNLHVFSHGCDEAQRMLAFRDHLRSHAADRERYAAEKRRLAAQKWTYVQDYADAKTAVVQEILAHISALPLTSIQ